MVQYIDKAKVAAELKQRRRNWWFGSSTEAKFKREECDDILSLLDTFDVKEVEEKFERPNIEAKDAVEVLSRMPHIDKSLLPIAEFIMEYCSWNLHKDEWNQPVLEVPLFRVLDALVQKGKPYCEG